MSAWVEDTLGSVCDIIKRGIAPKYTEQIGTCVINQKCIRDHRINLELARLHDSSLKTVNPERLIRVGDVLVNSTGTGTLGRVAQVKDTPEFPCTVDTHVTIVRPKEGLFFIDFFGYALIKIEDEIIASGEGASGQTELPRKKLEEQFKVSYPESYEEQKQIVTILDKAFAAIDQAQANIQHNIQNAQDLFQSKLNQIFSQQGDGWEEKTLKEISVEFGRGKSKHRPRNDPALYGGSYPFIQTGDVRNSDHLIEKYTKTYNEAGLNQSKLWPKGTVCLTIAANIAETGVLSFDACFPDSVIGIVVNEEITSSSYVEFLLQAMKVRIQAKGKGSAQANINLGTFEKEFFPFPALKEQVKVMAELTQLSQSITNIENTYDEKSKNLEELKKSLLQKAFSGELTKDKQAA